MHKIVFTEILALLLGRKYYANIINTKGTSKCEVSSFIFRNKKEAMEHRKRLDSTVSYGYVETISFRSRKRY